MSLLFEIWFYYFGIIVEKKKNIRIVDILE